MKYLITQELANQILNYLATRPYAESYQLVQGLQGIEKYEEEVKTDEKNNEEVKKDAG